MKNNIKYFAIAAMMLLGMNATAQSYSNRTVSANGSSSKWTFNKSTTEQKITSETTDNEIVFAPGTIKVVANQGGISIKDNSTIYIPVPSQSAGTIKMVVYGTSDNRWFQLFVDNTDAGATKRLYSKPGEESKGRGPQEFTFTASDITTYNTKTYLKLKDNNTEMKVTSFEVVLTSGAYPTNSTGGGEGQTGGGEGQTGGGEGQTGGGEGQTGGGEGQTGGGEGQTGGGEGQTGGGEGQTGGGEGQTGGGSTTVPETTLTIHEPEVYEAPLADGGYNTELTSFGNREYEVFYATCDNSGHYQVSPYLGRKQNGITISTTDNYSCKATDGWLDVHAYTSKTDHTLTAKDEFAAGDIAMHKLTKDGYYELHIKGYDQFSFYGKDNSTTISTDASKNKRFQVYIDGVLQPETQVANAATIRRYNITPTEHLIKVVGIGTANNEFYGFSLRVADVPKMKFVAGDTAQTAQQARAIEPVTYYHKNKKAAAELSWVGAAIPGISLQEGTNDTLYLQGTADAQCGTYRYVIAAKQNGEVVSTQTGTITIRTGIHATFGNTGTANAYEDNVMDNIVWNYDALSTDSVICTWDNGNEPAGLTFTKDQTTLTLTLGGTPTSVGTYTYTLICGDTIHGTVIVRSTSATIVPGAMHTILYLNKEYDNAGDHIFAYLKTEYNYLVRPATDVMADAAQYNKYDVIVISEDVDATSGEVLSIIRTLAKPVLNMKAFTYSSSRLGWGDPNNGSISNTSIDVMQPGHPVFTSPYPLTGSNIEIISAVGDNKRGIMCADITLQGSFALASAPKRGDDYFSDGENAVFLHEVPADMHNNAKYLLLPIATGATLTENGKKLINNCIEYLCSTQQSTIVLPTLRIEVFQINGVSGVIDHKKKTIDVNLPYGTDITALTPVITVSDPQATFISPADGETVDFSDTHYGVNYTLSDGINKVVYTVKVHVATALEEISGYVPGEWVNIYDVQGHLITTTNEDVRTMDLQRGIYLIVTESGVTTKLLRN